MLAHRRGDAALSGEVARDLPVAHLPAGEELAALDAGRLADRLTASGRRLATLPGARRLDAWNRAVQSLLDPSSGLRQALDSTLAASVRLSSQGLDAGLRAVASGMTGASAEALFRDAERRPPASRRAPALVVLASNLPGLALQTVLPALARGRPLILRSSRLEPHFAPALLGELARTDPEIGSAFAALTWEPGSELETVLLERCDRVLAYGGHDALEAIRRRVGDRLVGYGPKLSIGLVDAAASDRDLRALARDVALFDQRGCLSVQIVLSLAPADRVAANLLAGLDDEARALPPGPAAPDEAAAVRRELDLARMRGARVLPAEAGWVVVEAGREPVRASPGRRFVSLRPVGSCEDLRSLLTPLAGALQGAAVAGPLPRRTREMLGELGVSRIAPAGRLQETDARWHNGGIDPLEVL